MINRRAKAAGAGLVVVLVTALIVGPGGWPASAAVVTHQAENATIVNGVVESNHAGFTGTGFVNSANAVGAAVEWTFTPAAAGGVTLRFRNANGATADRSATVVLNGETVAAAPFPSTGGWTNWANENVTATLRSGSNTVRITATTAGGLANIDSLIVDDGQGSGSVPIADPIPQNPVQSGLGLTLTEFGSQFPRTMPTAPTSDQRLNRWARLNFISQIPGGGRLAVPDLNGPLYTVSSTGGSRTVYTNLRTVFGNDFHSGQGMGTGFAFVAFHPDFATNGRFYTNHSEARGALTNTAKRPDWTQSGAVVHSVITEWTATNPAATTFSGTRRTIMRIGFAGFPHQIQQIDFNPTATPGSPDYGMLYIAVGDGSIGYRTTVPQNLGVPHGKILRIDPQGTNGINGRYGFPSSNPFVGRPGARGEIYAIGMRDPHRFSWDTTTRRMFLGHIGEHAIEAIYDVRAGDNFGWSDREGAFLFDRMNRCSLYTLPSNDAEFGFTYPVAAYDHPVNSRCEGDLARAVVGGFVYRGGALPALQGKYVWADLIQGWVYYTNESEMVRGGPLPRVYQLRIFNAAGTGTTMKALADAGNVGPDGRVDLRFGVDRAGELYIIAKANGRIWKVTGVRGTAP